MSDILDRAEAIPDVDMARIVDFGNGKTLVHEREWNALMRAHDMLPELIAEIKQQAAYVARLETAFTRLYVNELVGCNMQRDIAEKHAREALERIRGEQE